MASKPRGISRQNSAGFNLCWSWGPQLKPPPPWECQLLALKQPLQCTVDPEGITLHGPFVYEALGGKGVRLKHFSVCSGKFHSVSQPRKPTCPQALPHPQPKQKNKKTGIRKCCPLVDIFCNYHLITLACRHLNSQGPGF